jgi:endoglucanase
MVMPGVTKLPRYVVQKGVAATLDFAAVTAQASRILRKFKQALPGLADSCLAASKFAWRWASQHPSLEYNQNAMNGRFEPKVTTGGYGDKKFTDEWYWAACELYCSTIDEQYYGVVRDHINDSMGLPSWANVSMLGYYTLVRMAKTIPDGHSADVAMARKNMLRFADGYLEHIRENAFATVMGQSRRDFNWGSNSNAANQSVLLINAWMATKEKKYMDAALTNLDYILGRNATGYCFVTGVGSKPTMHPHHRPSVADGVEEPVPGLLAGGPNPARQDGCRYEFTEPETAYTDDACSYASNEIAINWNAPLVYISNAIEALQYIIGYSSK